MTNATQSQFNAPLLGPAKSNSEFCAFVVLPKAVSDTLPRRGRTTVEGTINGCELKITLEPDGQLSHWMPISEALLDTAGLKIDDVALFDIAPVKQEPEPSLPTDFELALAANTEARAVWDDTTTIARLDWIHWITSAKQSATRKKRCQNACDMLASGKRRVCCFDPSGYYSKAFSAPQTAK